LLLDIVKENKSKAARISHNFNQDKMSGVAAQTVVTKDGALITAVRSGDAVSIRKILASEPGRVDERTHKHKYHYKDNATPLFSAAEQGDVAVINALLDFKADTSLKGWWSQTPLMLAAQKGHVEAVRALLTHASNRADPNVVGGWNDGTALFNAIVSGNADLVSLLLDNGANANHIDKDGCSPLHAACAEGRLDICLLLASRGSDIHLKNKAGTTPLEMWSNGLEVRAKSNSESSAHNAVGAMALIILTIFVYLYSHHT